jgi:hypothetical protein
MTINMTNTAECSSVFRIAMERSLRPYEVYVKFVKTQSL